MDPQLRPLIAIIIMFATAMTVIILAVPKEDELDEKSAIKEESKQEIVEHELKDGTSIIIMENSNGELEVIELE